MFVCGDRLLRVCIAANRTTRAVQIQGLSQRGRKAKRLSTIKNQSNDQTKQKKEKALVYLPQSGIMVSASQEKDLHSYVTVMSQLCHRQPQLCHRPQL